MAGDFLISGNVKMSVRSSRLLSILNERLPGLTREWTLEQEPDLLREARRRSPVKTGYMRRRLRTHTSAGGFIYPALHLIGRAYYTKFVNDGTKNIQPPRRFMDRAIEDTFRTRVTSKPWRRGR